MMTWKGCPNPGTAVWAMLVCSLSNSPPLSMWYVVAATAARERPGSFASGAKQGSANGGAGCGLSLQIMGEPRR